MCPSQTKNDRDSIRKWSEDDSTSDLFRDDVIPSFSSQRFYQLPEIQTHDPNFNQKEPSLTFGLQPLLSEPCDTQPGSCLPRHTSRLPARCCTALLYRISQHDGPELHECSSVLQQKAGSMMTFQPGGLWALVPWPSSDVWNFYNYSFFIQSCELVCVKFNSFMSQRFQPAATWKPNPTETRHLLSHRK